MTLPTTIRSGNSVTAQYNTTQAETPKPLTSKQEKVLNALEQSLPFFSASDYGVKAKKGEADTPPVHTGGGKGSNDVKDFFKSIGKAIASGFEKIGAFFKSLGKADTPSVKTDTPSSVTSELTEIDTPTTEPETPPTRYGDTNIAKPNISTPNPGKGGGQIAFAYTSGGKEGLTKMIGGLAGKLDSDCALDPQKRPIDAFMEEKFNFTSDLGHGLHGVVLTDVKELVPELKVHFADNPTALKLLDAISDFNFGESVQASFDHEVGTLTGGSNPLGRFMRNGNDFSLGMVALARSSGFDPDKVSNQILTPHMGEMASLEKELRNLPPEDRKKEVLQGNAATKMMELTQTILNDALKTDGLIEAFGQDHIDRLNGFAQQIADRDDLPVDVRNQAIQTLYVDNLFLRNIMSNLASTTKPGSVESTAVQLGQSIVNGANGNKFQTQDMREAYNSVLQDFRQNFVDSMIAIGMPVVE